MYVVYVCMYVCIYVCMHVCIVRTEMEEILSIAYCARSGRFVLADIVVVP